MRDIESMTKQVTLEEFEAGRDLYNLLRERGYNSSKAAGIVYRAGCIDGKKEAGDRQGREIGRLHEIINELKGKTGQPEADAETVTLQREKEGSDITNG